MSSKPLTPAAAAAWNRKSSISAFVNSFPIPFEMKEDAIDLREMSKNYPGGVIPLEDIHQGICAVLDPSYGGTRVIPPYDPSTNLVSPKFAYVEWHEMYLWPIFQRDVATNHVDKIFKAFDPTCILVACAIKLTLRDHESYGSEGKTVYCLWDGHHTTQVCKLRNYTKFPLWYIDIDHIPDSTLTANGFGTTDAERIKYGIYLAGTNMRMINLTIKRPLDPYDDFLIGVETYDADYVAVMNILKSNNCVVKRRKSPEPGALTQIKAAISCYNMADKNDVKGKFFDRALAFHRKHWPGAPLVLEIFRPMTFLYYTADIQNIKIPVAFDDELGQMLSTNIGDVDTIQQLFKKSYHDTLQAGMVSGDAPKHDHGIIMNAILNYYRQNAGPTQHIIPSPVAQWLVDIPAAMAASNSAKQPAASKVAKHLVSKLALQIDDIDDIVDDIDDMYDVE